MSNEKNIKIFINGREQTVTKGKMTYDEIVALVYPTPDFDNNTYKVTYFRKDNKHEGSLTKGQEVELIDGISFTIVRAIRS